MTTPKLSILTFPQRLEGGKLHFRILLLPRNINPLTALEPGFAAFADAVPGFKAMVINSLDGLPLTTSVTRQPDAQLISPVSSSRQVWEALKAQLEDSDKLRIDDTATNDANNQAGASLSKYKNVGIRKYLPQTYRNAFNYTRPKTKFATTGDEYHCSIKNSAAPTDIKTNRDVISWGKAIALCLRNPMLAIKAGMIVEASIDITAGLFDEGGWLYVDFGAGSSYAGLNKDLQKRYAARIPALKGLSERTLFAAVQFPVADAPVGNAGYDEIMQEAIMYDDGFAKIVHVNQPVNDYLLEEDDKTNPPQKDIGIRLGWDDEQLTIWQNRQMLQKEERTGEDVDAPLGVFSYCIDARKQGDVAWRSQNQVVAPGGVALQQIQVAGAGTKVELGSEVHPAAHGNSATEGFWLPMYFANWIGKSLAIPDKDAQEIHHTQADKIKPSDSRYTDPAYYESLDKTPPYTDAEIAALIDQYKKNNTIQTVPKQTFNPYLQPADDILPLEYGQHYDFRVRLMDLAGGTPAKTKKPLHGAQSPVASLLFKRHTAAAAVRILNVSQTADTGPAGIDTSVLENIVDPALPALTIRRPGLAYPAVVFTGKYTAPDAVTRLKDILNSLPADPKKPEVNISLPDPDVNQFKVLVEMQTLQMDNALSVTGREPYVKLYEKDFDFSNNRDESFKLDIIYQDFSELPFDGSFPVPAADAELLLPTARHLRLTFISVVSDADNIYADESVRFGKTTVLSAYKAAESEPALLEAIGDGLKAMYLQPESATSVKPAVSAIGPITIYPEKQVKKSTTPVELQRIAAALHLSASNLTLEGLKGERVQFGCTRQMRHSLAPDSSSVTFSSLAEVFNHWIVAVTYTMRRDWTWDGLEVNSLLVTRQVANAAGPIGGPELAGIIKVSRTANINALSDAQRDHVNLVFLDTLDPKDYNPGFPQELSVTYTIEPKLLSNGPAEPVPPVKVNLPVTTIPAQVPKLVSAGMALSPYEYDEQKYDKTNTRQKFLWLELEEPPLDPDDTYYIRVLANAPDPMLCLVDRAIMFNVPEEPPLNIDAEAIRIIVPGMTNDFGGMGAMQEMVAEQGSGSAPRFYMVPLPPGLHSESDELFGFFTYEIRVGHKKELWSAAQGRYGRPLKVNGVQHPAPALVCNTSRRKILTGPLSFLNEVVITAPFANAVMDGRNVAAQPPQTTLWAFLYVQVKQADGKAFRNILLASRLMSYKRNETQPDEGNRYGLCSFNQLEISAYLKKLGQPVSGRMSVLCVEMFPLHNRWRTADLSKDFSRFENAEIDRQPLFAAETATAAVASHTGSTTTLGQAGEEDILLSEYRAAASNNQFNPLIDGLGRFRIYRTSALVPVENICCDDC